MKQKNNSTIHDSSKQQNKSARLSDLMTDSEVNGREYRKKHQGQDVLKNKIHHQESKAENPRK